MGSSASKATRAAAGSATRKYPSRIPPTNPSPRPSNAPSEPPVAGQVSRPGPTVRPQPQVSETRDEAINLDASDPVYAAHLRTLGAVKPHNTLYDAVPHSSSSSSPPNTVFDPDSPTTHNPFLTPHFPTPATTNPALTLLAARQRLQEAAEAEFERVARQGRGALGREFLDVVTIRQVLMLRDEQGVGAGEIERRLGLREGVVGRLGTRGVVEGV